MRHREIVVQATVYTLAHNVAQPMALVAALIVRGRLGPYLSGVLGTLTLLTFYTGFLHFGLLLAAERELPIAVGAGDRARFERIRRITLSTCGGSGLVFSAGLLVWVLVNRSTLSGEVFVMLLSVCAIAMFQQVNLFCITLLRAAKEYLFLARSRVLVSFLQSILSVLAVVFFGFHALLIVLVGIAVFETLYSYSRVGHPLRPGWNQEEATRLARVGFSLLTVGLVVTALRTVDNLIVLNLLGVEQLGLYSIALMANNTVWGVMNSLSTALFTRMGEARGAGGPTRLEPFLRRPSLLVAVLLPIISGILFIAVPHAIREYLPAFAAGISAFKIIIVGTFFLGMAQLPAAILIMVDRQHSLLKVQVAAVCVAAAGGLTAASMEQGLAGVAAWTVAGYAISFFGVYWMAIGLWMGPRDGGRFLARVTAPAAYAAALLLALDAVAGEMSGSLPPVILALGQVTAFLVAYTPCLRKYEKHTKLMGEIVGPSVRRAARWLRRSSSGTHLPP